MVMAAEDVPVQKEMTQQEEQQLKYLEFVQVAAVHATLCFLNLYGYAKERSGPLKTGVETVEGTVKTVVGPVYDKYHGVPIEVLKFVDRKIEESVTELDKRVPPVLKQVSSQAFLAAQQAPVAAQAVAHEFKRAGVKDTASGIAKNVYSKYEPTAKEIYFKYEPKMEQCAASAWRKLNKLPLFPQVAQVAVPTAAYYAEKYNSTVRSTFEKGYRFSGYLPILPTERIARVFQDEDGLKEPLLASNAGETGVAAH